MKLIHSDEQNLTFQLRKDELDTVMDLLRLYPVVPPAHHQVSKELTEPKLPEYQHLLDEALAEQRTSARRLLEQWLAAPERIEQVKTRYHLRVERSNVEWLLQVLNDIRVGSWLLLGSPAQPLNPRQLDPKLIRHWVAMEFCGMLQMILLEALG